MASTGAGSVTISTAESHIRAVLFDFGGVIAEEGFETGLRSIAKHSGLNADMLARAGMDAVYDSGFVTGTGSEQDFWQLLRERTGIIGAVRELTEAVLSRFIVRPWFLDDVKLIRQAGYLTAILSDQTEWLERLNERYDFNPFFDRVFVSYRIGKGKRDPSLFDDVMARLAIPAASALFIDDNTGNIERARQRGLQALAYHNREQFEREVGARLGLMITRTGA